VAKERGSEVSSYSIADGRRAIAHNKIMVIAGPFNFTRLLTNCHRESLHLLVSPKNNKEGEMKKTAVLVGALILAMIGYAAVGPLITIRQLKSGLEQQDSEKLSEYIDFPTLRTNLKEQINSELIKHAATGLEDKPFLAMGLAFTPKLVETIVDSLVTPSGMSNLMAGKKPQQREKKQPTQGSRGEERRELFKNSRYSYDSPSKFSVWVKNDSGEEIRFVLTRDGLSWRLSNIAIAGFLTGLKIR
jgi:hypothetical protein